MRCTNKRCLFLSISQYIVATSAAGAHVCGGGGGGGDPIDLPNVVNKRIIIYFLLNYNELQHPLI